MYDKRSDYIPQTLIILMILRSSQIKLPKPNPYTYKTKFLYCKQEVIFTLSCKNQKLLEQFTYPACNITSTESDVNIRLEKAWTAIDRFSRYGANPWSNTFKRVTLRPLTSNLTNHPSKTIKTCWRSKDEFIRDVLLWTPAHDMRKLPDQKEHTYIIFMRTLDAV